MTTRVRNLREILPVSWTRYDFLVEELAYRITENPLNSDLKSLKYVYGIPRGGLVIAVCLSHRLRIPLVPDEQALYGVCNNLNTLIVDDICDTGKTLELFNTFYTATLFVRSTLPPSKRPTVFCTEVDKNLHVQFPYENLESTL